MEPSRNAGPDPDKLSRGIVVWTGRGHASSPSRSEDRLVAEFGDERAAQLLPLIRALEDEFYESDARHTARDLATMGDAAAARFRELHPELTDDAIEALVWCYTFDFK
jgi:hypothetical protein